MGTAWDLLVKHETSPTHHLMAEVLVEVPVEVLAEVTVQRLALALAQTVMTTGDLLRLHPVWAL